MATIEERVMDLIRENLRNIPEYHSINSDDDLTNDLDMDGFDSLALFTAIDVEFPLPAFSDGDLFSTVHTVGELIQYVKQQYGR